MLRQSRTRPVSPIADFQPTRNFSECYPRHTKSERRPTASLICTGKKSATKLQAERKKRKDNDHTSPIVLPGNSSYPFPEQEVIRRNSNHRHDGKNNDIVWGAGRGPANMGALFNMLPRPEAASAGDRPVPQRKTQQRCQPPRTGSSKAHEVRNKKLLLTLAFNHKVGVQRLVVCGGQPPSAVRPRAARLGPLTFAVAYDRRTEPPNPGLPESHCGHSQAQT